MSKGRSRKCEACGADGFYAIERGEFFPLRIHVCQKHLRRGDKIFDGRYGSKHFTIYTYQTSEG